VTLYVSIPEGDPSGNLLLNENDPAASAAGSSSFGFSVTLKRYAIRSPDRWTVFPTD
jgi:hypothetical protein